LCWGWHRDQILGRHFAWGYFIANQYPTLYNIVRTKEVLVADVLSQNPLNIRSNRILIGEKWDAWIHLVTRLINSHLNDEPDIFKWHLTTTGLFTVKSMYADCINENTIFLKKYLWKIKVPLKIRNFMWFLYNKMILTKDNDIGHDVLNVCFVVLRRQLTTFFYILLFFTSCLVSCSFHL
jgi:hypothetical protein